MYDQTGGPQPSTPNFVFPLLIGLVAFALFLVFQTTQILRERSVLTTAYQGQEVPLQESNKVRQQLESIAQKTAELAAKGNTNAQTIVNDLARQGIRIDTKKPAGTP